MTTSRNSRRYASDRDGTTLRARERIDRDIDRWLPKTAPVKHRFTIFRMGLDMCAKCQKSRKEHKT